MVDANRKLQLIAEILQLENETVLDELERVINNSKVLAAAQQTVNDVPGNWSTQDVDEMNRIIEEGFM